MLSTLCYAGPGQAVWHIPFRLPHISACTALCAIQQQPDPASQSLHHTICTTSALELGPAEHAVLCLAQHAVVLQALEGYVEPGPGGDPIRNPAVLPTGKNIHALDPQSIPTQAALKSARVVVER